MGSQELSAAGVSLDVWEGEGSETLVLLGQIDGALALGRLSSEATTSVQPLQVQWSREHKTPLRRVRFTGDGRAFAATAGRSIVEYDVETGKRRRVLAKATKAAPFALLPFAKGSFSVLAGGDESGGVRLWDWRSESPLVAEFSVHEDYVSDLAVTEDGRQLVSASADSTVAGYSVPGKKLIVQSEPVAAELLSLAYVRTEEGQSYFAAGAGDGHLELFRRGEYGNLLERAETKHKGTLDCLRALGPDAPNFLLSASNEDGAIRLLHLHPHRDLAMLGHHEDGAEEVALARQASLALSVGHDLRFRVWDVAAALAQVPRELLKTASAKKMSKTVKLRTAVADPAFFDGLAKRDGSTLDVPDGEDDEDWEDDSEEEEEEPMQL